MAIKAIEICMVSRLNQGFHHPTYNPNGSKLASDGKKWYETAVSFTSISDCFSGEKLQTASGYIGTTSARPDGLFYDQVSENSITDLRNSSAKVEDYNRLIDREFNKLVSGVYRGSEGEWQIIKTKQTLGSGTWTRFGVAKVAVNGSPYELIGKSIYHNSQVRRIVSFNGSDAGNWYFDINSSLAVVLDADIFIPYQTTRTKSNTLTHTDIIGSPTNYPTYWTQSGVSGTPLVVAEDGTSLLPTGSLTVFKLSRKANATPLQVLKSTDSGATWTALTVTTHYTFSTTTNAITFVTAPASIDLVMVTYQTHTNMALPAVNSEVLAIGDVWGANFSTQAHGAFLVDTFIKKIPTSASFPLSFRSKPLTWYTPSAWYTASEHAPTHSHFSLFASNPAVKALPYLTRINGKARLQMLFKELKHNGTSWGDDSKFNIVDNVSTTTDNNAQTVLIGQKYCELPYFISAGE